MAMKIVLSSTKETEPIYFNNEYYPNYPKIRAEDINTDTSNKFVDTFIMSNLYLPGAGGDYDGDQVTTEAVHTIEANDEIREFINSKQNFMDFGCRPLRESTADVIQSVYSLTKVLSDTKLTQKISFSA